jgi:MarR family transcriptional regulator, organic hydroperoxide resistance regulator
MRPAAPTPLAKQPDPERAGSSKRPGPEPIGSSKRQGSERAGSSSKRQGSERAGSSSKRQGSERAGSSSKPSGAEGAGERGGAASASAPVEPAWTAELDELGKAFRRVFRGLSRLRGRDTHLGGSELSHAQFELLIELYERGELPAGELAAAARLTPATVTQMLEHLADRGHVERARSEIDRRVVVSRLTPRGRRKIEAKRAAWQERWQAALQDMGPRELRAATRVLERLSAAFEDAPPAGSCPESSPGAGAKTA